MSRPAPSNFRPLNGPDVYAAVGAWVAAMALPALDPARIFRAGRPSPQAPPALADGDYAILAVTAVDRVGTNVHEFAAGEGGTGRLRVKKLERIAVCIAFCSSGDEGRRRAALLETVCRDELGARFFEPYGLSPLYADAIAEDGFAEASGAWARRSRLVLHLSGWTEALVDMPFFEDVNLNLENADVHHPVTDPSPSAAAERPQGAEAALPEA